MAKKGKKAEPAGDDARADAGTVEPKASGSLDDEEPLNEAESHDASAFEEAPASDDASETIDFTSLEPDVPPPERDPQVRLNPVDEHREKARHNIAMWLLVIVGAIVVASFAIIARLEAQLRAPEDFKIQVEAIKDLALVFFTPLIGVLGAVVGFYYGKKADA